MKKPFTNPTPIEPEGKVRSMKRKINLQFLIAGIPDLDLMKYKLAGEDLVNDSMKISIYDLPDWIKHGARTTLNMSKEDLRLLKDYFKHVDLRRIKQKPYKQ